MSHLTLSDHHTADDEQLCTHPFIKFFNRQLLSSASDIALELSAKNAHVTYQCLAYKISAQANVLRSKGVRPGDYVMVLLSPDINFIILYYSLFYLGAIPVLIDNYMPDSHRRHCFEQIKPAFTFYNKQTKSMSLSTVPPVLLGKLISVEDLSFPLLPLTWKPFNDYIENPICFMYYTSGTTGKPKGVPWYFSQVDAHIFIQKNYFEKHGVNSELVLFPFFALTAIAIGLRCVIPPIKNFQPDTIDVSLVLSYAKLKDVQYIFASPAFWLNIVDRLDKQSENFICENLKLIVSAGAAVSPYLFDRLQRVFPNASICTTYGATEAIMPLSYISRESMSLAMSENKQSMPAICLGKPIGDAKFRILSLGSTKKSDFISQKQVCKPYEIGEIIVAGPTVTTHYFERDDLTRKTKLIDADDTTWHRLGDAGYLDQMGRLWFCSRVKHIIYIKGVPYYPDYIEQYCCDTFKVTRCALSIIQDDSTVKLVLVFPKGIDYPSHHELLTMLNRHDIPVGAVINLACKFPVDARHNSKIDRLRLAELVRKQANSIKQYEALVVD